MSEQYQEDSSTKKPTKVKHSFKKAFSRHSQSIGSPNSLSASAGPTDFAINPASILLDELVNSLTSIYIDTKKQ